MKGKGGLFGAETRTKSFLTLQFYAFCKFCNFVPGGGGAWRFGGWCVWCLDGNSASLGFINLSGDGREEIGLKLNRDSQSPDPATTDGG